MAGPDSRGHRLAAWALLLGAGLALVLLGAQWIPWHWLPGGPVTAVPADSVFTAAQVRRGEDFAGSVRPLAWAATGITVLAVTAAARAVRPGGGVARLLTGRRWPLRALAGTAGLVLLERLVALPFVALIEHRRRSVGLSTQSWSAWLVDQATSALVAWVALGVVVLVVVGALRRFGACWFGVSGLVLAGLTVLAGFVYPVAVEPLFSSTTSLPQGPLRTSLVDLADREHVAVSDILVADASRRTTALNASVSGFGSTRRIVLYDTLITDLPPEEIRLIVAHELGHAGHDDVGHGVVLAALGVLVASGAAGVVCSGRLRPARGSEVLLVPGLLAALAWGSLLVAPMQNAASRAVEARADVASLDATGDVADFVAVQRRLALSAVADPTPPRWSQWWFGTHPTVLQRIGLAQAWSRDQEVSSRTR